MSSAKRQARLARRSTRYATFDFRFPRALTADEVDRVSRLLNAKIRADLVRRVEELPLDQAIKTARSRSSTKVRRICPGRSPSAIGPRELCGGTHVERTRDRWR